MSPSLPRSIHSFPRHLLLLTYCIQYSVLCLFAVCLPLLHVNSQGVMSISSAHSCKSSPQQCVAQSRHSVNVCQMNEGSAHTFTQQTPTKHLQSPSGPPSGFPTTFSGCPSPDWPAALFTHSRVDGLFPEALRIPSPCVEILFTLQGPIHRLILH